MIGNILFIGTNNTARSLIAEGFAKKIAPEGINIFSAGNNPALVTNPLVFEVMQEHGIDIKSQKPKTLSSLQGQRFDLAITLCSSAKEECGPLPGAPSVVHWNIDDPSEFKGTDEAVKKEFQNCADTIKMFVADLFGRGYFDAFVMQKRNMDLLLDNLSEGILAHDLNRKIVFFNEGVSRLTGLLPSDVIGKDCHDIFKPRLCDENCSFCDKSDFAGFQKKSYSSILYDHSGRRKDLDVTVLPMKDGQGVMEGVIALFNDQTEIKYLEQRLGKEIKFGNIVGTHHKMLQVFEQITDVAAYDVPVYIYGETGTGKELVARAIHNESPRRNAPFVPINCGALPEGLVESELFGHVKGSFSGAVRDKKGRFEMADNGTIFLDEVAELPKNIQVKLLRFLQEGILEKVGSEKSVSADVRIISATNKNLKQEVKKGSFRDDLYYRLNVIPIELPALREKKNDIPLLVEHFIEQAAEKNNTEKYRVSKEAMSAMMDYNWHGNVRELENAIQFAIVKCKGKCIALQDLPMELVDRLSDQVRRGPAKKLSIDNVRSALIKTGGNKAKAAKQLGVGRATLYRFINGNPEAIQDDY